MTPVNAASDPLFPTGETLQGFDRAAARYSQDWDGRPLVRTLRGRVLARVLELRPPPARVLDLGCGPGTDARLLAAAGYTVDAVDPSPGMVAVARARGVAARVADRPLDRGYDLVLSDFGALNAAPDLHRVAGWIADALVPGGIAVVVWMGPWCPAGALVLLARGRPVEALRRRRVSSVQVGGLPIPVRYWGPRDARRAFGPRFLPVRVEALGALVPPPDLGGVPGPLVDLEGWVAALPGIRHLGDHTLYVFRRR